jgi:hypothetical protein
MLLRSAILALASPGKSQGGNSTLIEYMYG